MRLSMKINCNPTRKRVEEEQNTSGQLETHDTMYNRKREIIFDEFS